MFVSLIGSLILAYIMKYLFKSYDKCDSRMWRLCFETGLKQEPLLFCDCFELQNRDVKQSSVRSDGNKTPESNLVFDHPLQWDHSSML